MGAIGLDEPSGGGTEEEASGGGIAGAAGLAILILSPPADAGAAIADTGTAMGAGATMAGAGAAMTGIGGAPLEESCWEISWFASGVPSTPQTGQFIA